MDCLFRKTNIVSLTVMIIIFSIFLLTIGCEEGATNLEKGEFINLQSVSKDKWEQLSNKKIFFGHQSLGNNIIEGIRTIKKEYPFVKLNIVIGRDHDTFSNGVFVHDKVGKNHDPKSKIDDFCNIININKDSQIDIAFVKFCFVDIDSSSDVNNLFKYYRTKMELLKKDFPEILYVHFTVPLIRAENKSMFSSIKNILKKILGKKTIHFFSDENKVARNIFKSLLLSEYKGKDPILISLK